MGEAFAEDGWTDTGVPVKNDTTVVIILKLELSATDDDTATLWVNPSDTSSEAALGTGASLTGDIAFDRMSLVALGGDTPTFDELRIADSLESALTAIPEPASQSAK